MTRREEESWHGNQNGTDKAPEKKEYPKTVEAQWVQTEELDLLNES